MTATPALIDIAHGWTEHYFGAVRICSTGQVAVGEILDVVRGGISRHSLTREMARLAGHFGLIVETENLSFACADKIRSYPIFYGRDGDKLLVSNSARLLRRRLGVDSVDDDGLLQLRMSGYVTGSDTVFEGLHQLQAGEYLLWDQHGQQLDRGRYYRFCSDSLREPDEPTLIHELGELTDRIFHGVIERAAGRPIWVPLSGGLDSRLVACKLAEFEYPHLQTFSYGPPANHEAKVGRRVAERLGLPWMFVPSRPREVRRTFNSDERRRYWEFADGLMATPNMQEFQPISTLVREGRLPSDAVLINGQAGDFISGGHIPESLLQPGKRFEDVVSTIVEKHFSLWSDLKTEENIRRIRKSIRNAILGKSGADGEARQRTPAELAALYEFWEWQERQVKYVANGQRVYDFFSLAWELPLWQEEYLRFWPHVPISLRRGQSLYRKYLHSYDYRGVFTEVQPEIWRWPGFSFLPILGTAELIRLLVGEHQKKKFLLRARYFGHYSWQYRAYPFRHFLKHADQHRNPMSFFAETWVEENLGRSPRAAWGFP